MEPLEIFFQDGPSFRWLHDNMHFVFDYTARGYKCVEIREADAATGRVRTLVQESRTPSSIPILRTSAG
jgi:hypothetical protein